MVTRMLHFLTVMAANKELSNYFFSESGGRMARRLGVDDFTYHNEGDIRSICDGSVVASTN